MPEGPSILILSEQLQPCAGKIVREVSGSSKAGIERLQGKKILKVKSWGKHLLIVFSGFYVRIHLLLFGTYRINEQKASKPRLTIRTTAGEVNFYACSIVLFDGKPEEHYDWALDTMSAEWDEKKVLKLAAAQPEEMVCDLLLDQGIFAGAGNIIKNEVLFRMQLHPETKVKDISARILKKLVQETRKYCFDFYKWKKEFTLKQHWQAHRKKTCPHCGQALTRKITGSRKRRSFFCELCQSKEEAVKIRTRKPAA